MITFISNGDLRNSLSNSDFAHGGYFDFLAKSKYLNFQWRSGASKSQLWQIWASKGLRRANLKGESVPTYPEGLDNQSTTLIYKYINIQNQPLFILSYCLLGIFKRGNINLSLLNAISNINGNVSPAGRGKR